MTGWLYQVLLRLCLPHGLREAHGAEMEALFAEQVAEARRRGRLAGWRAAGAGLLDVARHAPHDHWWRSGAMHIQHKEHPVQAFLIDMRHTLRAFRRERGTTALLVGTIALAVAANTVVFAMLDGVFRRPFPFPEPDRLVYLNERAPTWNLEYTGINYPDFVAWRRDAHTFTSMSLFGNQNVNLAEGGNAERVEAMLVTWDMAQTLGLRMTQGRAFLPEEDRPEGPPVVVIGEAIWRQRFAGAADVLGRSLRINGVSHTIVGVLPPEGAFPEDAALWLPMRENPNQTWQSYNYGGIGRLRADVTLKQAEQSLLDAHAPLWAASDTSHTVSPRVEPLRHRLIANYVAAGTALGVAAVLVFLIACTNVAGSIFARSIGRRKEIDIRVALGANAGRIVRQLLAESLMLSTVAGVIGTAVAAVTVSLLLRGGADFLPAWGRPSLGPAVVGFSVGIVVLAALLFGLAPALQLRRHVGAGMGGTRVAGSVPERRTLSALVVVEIALAAILLVSGGLLLRTYRALQQVDTGVRAEGVATFRVALPRATYRNGNEQRAYYERMVERLGAVPGVDRAGAITCLPLSCHNGNFFRAEGAPDAPSGSDPVVLIRTATPGYFETMGIRLVRGRFFAPGEGGPDANRRVAVINEEMAAHFWPAADPIGKRFKVRSLDTGDWITVVGLVRDARHYGLVDPMIPGLYLSTTSLDSASNRDNIGFAVHTPGDPQVLLPALQAAAREIDPELPLFEVRTMQAAFDRSLAQQRQITVSLAVFAAVSVMLAMGGIYAVLSYVVGRRRREIAIRMAIGAQREQILSLVLRQGLRLALLGALLGAPLALLAARAMTSLLAGVSASDPVTLLGALGALLILGAAAAALPAIRAAGLEPKAVLSENA